MPDTLIASKTWTESTVLGTGSAPFVGSGSEGGGVGWTDLGNQAGAPLHRQSGGKLHFAQTNGANNLPSRNSLTFRGTGASFIDGEVFSGGSTGPIGVIGRNATNGVGFGAFIYSGTLYCWGYSNSTGSLVRRYDVSTAVTATLTGDCVISMRLTQSGNNVGVVIKLWSGVNLGTFDPQSPGTPSQTYTPATFDATSYSDLRTAGYWGVGDYTGRNLSTNVWVYQASSALVAGSVSELYTSKTATKLSFSGASGGSGTKVYSLYRRLSGAGSYTLISTGLSPGSVYGTGLTSAVAYDFKFSVTDDSGTVDYTPLTLTTKTDAIAVFGDSNLDPAYGMAETSKAPYLFQTALTTAGWNTMVHSYAQSGTNSTQWATTLYISPVAEMVIMGIDKVIILVGTNDAKTSTGTTSGTYTSNINSIIASVRASIPTCKILLTAPAYVGATGEWANPATDNLIQAYGTAIRTIAVTTGDGIELLDGGSGSNFYQDTFASQGTYLGGDLVHWTTSGHSRIVTQYWLPVFAGLYLPILAAGTVSGAGGVNQLTVTATVAPSGGIAPYTRRVARRTPSGSGSYTYGAVSGSGPWTVTGLSAGTYDTFLEVVDAFGQVVNTNVVVATVTAPDTTPPTITTKVVNSLGTTLTLTNNEGCTGSTGLTITVNGVARAVVWTRSNTTTVVGEIVAPTILSTDVLLLSYSGGNIQDVAGNALVTITNAAVTNNSTQTTGGGGVFVTGLVVLTWGVNPRYAALLSRLRLQAYKSDRTTTGSPIPATNWREVGSGLGQYVWYGTIGTDIPTDAYYLAPYLLNSAGNATEVQGSLRSIPALQDWLIGDGDLLAEIRDLADLTSQNTQPSP